MAQRRMFSKDITENDAFLDMPLSTQALYFHLGMQADDDGFVSPNRILRMIGCQADDLRILVTKKFVLPFDDGIVVIKHWKMNNYLRNDRYKQTKHLDKMAQLQVKSNGSYSWYTNGIPLVDAGKVRIGKDTSDSNESQVLKNNSKDMPWNQTSDDYEEGTIDLDGNGEIKKEATKPARKYPNAHTVREVFYEVLGLNPGNWRVNRTELEACERLYTERGLDKVRNALEFYYEHRDEKFCPDVSSPFKLDSKYTALSKYKTQHEYR